MVAARPTGKDAVAWCKEAEGLGAGEICLNAIDTDGVRDGYELTITRLVADAVGIPVIASGGGGTPAHLVDAVSKGGADAALVASMVHSGDYTVGQIKDAMRQPWGSGSMRYQGPWPTWLCFGANVLGGIFVAEEVSEEQAAQALSLLEEMAEELGPIDPESLSEVSARPHKVARGRCGPVRGPCLAQA